MTEDELKKKEIALDKKYANEKKKLWQQFVNENNPYKPGDIIKDHYRTGEIVHFSYYVPLSGSPHCRYYCKNLTKKMTQSKKEPFIYIHQTNIQKV
jgi:hypothetical protein